ncbi:MAG: MerR family transcriptional regulator [Deltaproteobacteria bacterium]|nr:MerR family transcriptional regulator [Deltaproteobacteria bacterium]
MPRDSQNPRHRIQAVVEATGVPAPTLRAWEKRYGFPIPRRSAGGYRLYTEQDLEAVRRMNALTSEGIPAAEAARLVRERMLAEAEPESGEERSGFDQARDRILSAVQVYDSLALEEALALALGLGRAAVIYRRVLEPALIEVGERWHAGTFSVAQEHLCTQVVEKHLRLLSTLVQPPPPAPVVLLACIEEEQHQLGLYGVSLELAALGARAVILGAATPPDALGHAVAALEPAAVGLSAAARPPKAAALMRAYGRACGAVPWILGGLAASELSSAVQGAGGLVAPGDRHVSDDLRDLLTRARSPREKPSRGGPA